MTSLRQFCSLLFLLLVLQLSAFAQSNQPVTWNNALKQKSDWYSSPDAARVADNLLLYQRNSGGWPKNTDMAALLSDADKSKLVEQKKATDSTIDNSSTFTQLVFLARVFTAKPVERHREAFVKGFDYLLKAQYPNGGWPQFYPISRLQAHHLQR